MPLRKRPPANSKFAGGFRASPSAHLDSYCHYLKAECGMAENTLRSYAHDLQQFFAWYDRHGPARLQDVDLRLLTDYLENLGNRNLATTSIARHLVSIKMFFRYLVLEGVLAESKVELMNSPRLWQKLPKVLSPEKVEELLRAPGAGDRYALRDRAVLALLYATGCRASEVTDLKLRDVHLQENYCRCTGKGNKERLVSLNPVACAAIQHYLKYDRAEIVARRAEEPEWLLITRTGRPMTRIVVWQLVKKYAARIGCSADVSPHTLRHSFATHMLAGGAEIRALQELLGHASISTTQIYTQVEHSRLKAVHRQFHPRG